MIAGKKASILEKLWIKRFGVGFSCLFVREASSRATRRPRMETARAASLRSGGIVIVGVFRGITWEVIKRPAMMLPQARRLMGLKMRELFSLMGDSGRKRGAPIDTRKIIRVL